jgi:cation-transporting ATPase 13A3/4/5
LTQSEVEKAIFNSRYGGHRVELVIVGAAFNHLLEYYWLPQYIGEVRVFARMKPLDKVKCVRLHMANHITAMCGDGGNDAGALKAAHAGISLSGSGSSVVAHFSSTNLSLDCCVQLLRESRCSLDVSFAAYK